MTTFHMSDTISLNITSTPSDSFSKPSGHWQKDSQIQVCHDMPISTNKGNGFKCKPNRAHSRHKNILLQD